jgi:transcriptional regulator with XRE-family HTH domain
MTITGSQLLAARKALGWTQIRLGARADVGTTTINQFERGLKPPCESILLRLRSSLEEAGVTIDENGQVTLRTRK